MNKKTTIFLTLFTLLIFTISCSFGLSGKDKDSLPNSEGDLLPISTGDGLRQWASAATASSEYSSSDWSAAQATGAPDTECGDDPHAWAAASTDGKEWLELTYSTPVVPTEINIHQNYNASQIVEVDLISLDGETHVAWTGQAEQVDYCPDIMTITLPDQYPFPVIGVRLVVDQSILGLGWNEIDAVELVGYTINTSSIADEPAAEQSEPAQQQEAEQEAPSQPAASNANIPAPAGFLATPKVQAFATIVPFVTMESDLKKIMGEEGKLSTENWKPHPDHANTYIYDLGEGVTAYVGVLTSGEVYKTSISGTPQTMDVTVNNDLYQQMTDLYNQEYMLPYETVANLLGSPGLRIWYQLRDDNTMREDYIWYNAQGDYISGTFIDGAIRGFGGFAYVVK